MELYLYLFLLIVITTINIINYKAMINNIDRTVEVVANPKANFFKEFEKPIEPRLTIAVALTSTVTIFAESTKYSITYGMPQNSKEMNHDYITIDEGTAESEC